MRNVDVIGIGALNFDYICRYSPPRGEGPGIHPESGGEDLDYKPEQLDRLIRKFLASDPAYRVRFGGSAYLTIKTIGALGLGLRTGFVGVRGTPGPLEAAYGVGPEFVINELRHLHSSEWILPSSMPPGRALVLTHKGQRHDIRIDTGANNELLSEIEHKEAATQVRLVEYLASAQWVHVSSLSDRHQFAAIVDRIRSAKEINSYLRASIDPGHEYTKKHSEWLGTVLDPFDFVFLNQKELRNLQSGSNASLQSEVDLLRAVVRPGTQVLVLKDKAKTELVQFAPQRLLRTYWHQRLAFWQIKDDTGAGDVFAGGVIAGLLTDKLLAHQPAPIALGAGLAKTKLQSHEFPTERLASYAADFLAKGMKLEDANWRQRLKMLLDTTVGYWVAFMISFLSGLASGVVLFLLTSP